MKYVIIGNSAAGIGTVEGIRQVDQQGEITIISNEPHHTYSRPLISYLLSGKTDEQRMKYRKDSFYEDNNCRRVFGQVVKIDPRASQVELADGSSIPYDKLMVATGSDPFVPRMEGLETVVNQVTFMSLDSAKKLESMLSPGARVLIIGAGLIGLKCAEGIEDKVGSITVVDLADRILSSILDAEGAAIVQKHIESKGVQFILSNSVARFAPGKATMADGQEVDFDILVLAVGVRPNVDLVKNAGGEVNRGIRVNEYLQTTLPNIYSAGDCVESYDITIDQNRVLALLPNAYMQGECAGVNMAGGERAFDKAIPMNAIGFFGLHIITAGSYTGDVHADASGTYKKLYTKDGLLKGYMLIGDVKRAGIYTNLIREKTPLDSIDFDLISKHPSLMAFSRKERNIKLGGAKK